MQIAVCSTSLERAGEFLFKLMEDFPENSIMIINRNKNNAFFQLLDGTKYMIISKSMSSIGYKCDKIYIDYGLDIDTIQEILLPIVHMSKLPREEQIVYFE